MRQLLSRSLLLGSLAAIVLGLASCHSSSPTGPAPSKKWEFSTGALHPLPKNSRYDDQIPAIGSDGTIYAPGTRGLYAINPDGSQKWFHDDPYQSRGFPVRFVLIDDNGNIWFDDTVDTGKLTGGAIEVDPKGQSSPAGVSRDRVTQLGEAYDGKVYVGMVQMVPIRIDGSNDQTAPFISGAGFAFAPDGIIYATWGDELVRYEPNGVITWKHEVPGAEEPVLGTDGTIYVGGNGVLAAVNPDGTGKWSFTLRGQLFFAPSVADDGTVYFGCDDKNVYALGSDGRVKWKFATDGAVRSTPAIAKNGTIYFGSLDNNIYAVGSDGKLKWKFKTAGQVFSPTLADDGTVYVQNGEGKLFAIQDGEQNGGPSGQWAKRYSGPRNTARGGR